VLHRHAEGDDSEATEGERSLESTRRKGAMGFKVVVDFDKCESNALCMGVAPEVFEVRDDDFLYILDETPPESMRERIEEAVRRCPKQALSIAED
jgi:ferredoxin